MGAINKHLLILEIQTPSIKQKTVRATKHP